MGLLKVMTDDVSSFVENKNVKVLINILFSGLMIAAIISCVLIILFFALAALAVLLTTIQMSDVNLSFAISLAKFLAGCLLYVMIYWVVDAWHRSRLD